MNIKKLRKIFWIIPILLGVLFLLTGVACIVEFDMLVAECLRVALEADPNMASDIADRQAHLLAYASIVQWLIGGVAILGASFIGIAGKGRLKRDRVRKVMLLLAPAIIFLGTCMIAEIFDPSAQAPVIRLFLGLALIVGGTTSVLPIKWDKKFPIVLVCTGLMVAMQIADIRFDISSPAALWTSVGIPLLLVVFYVFFFLVTFKCMQLACDFNPTISERIAAGEAIARPPAFYEQIETILMTKVDMMDLFYAIKRELPDDIEATALTDTEKKIYLNAEYWSAIIEKRESTDCSDVCAIRFPDFKVDYQVENEYRAIEEMNIALTAIEKSILTMDAQALAQIRHASTNARAATISSINNESVDTLQYFTVSSASRAAVNVAVALGGKAADDATSEHMNKQAEDTLNQAEPLVLRYLGTPALPESVHYDAASSDDPESTVSQYAIEATKEEPSYKMTPNRKLQLARSITGLIAVAVVTTLFSFLITLSIPGVSV